MTARVWGRMRGMFGARRRDVLPRSGQVLLTGAAGMIAGVVRPALAARYPVRLSDIITTTAIAPAEEFVAADLRRDADVDRVVAGVTAIVHLGAVGRAVPLAELIEANVVGVESLLRAAVQHDVGTVILASTMHVLGMYDRDTRVSPASPPRPDSAYARSKLMAEEIGRLHAAKHGLRVCCVRIGCYKPERSQSEPGGWIGPDDLSSLLQHLLQHPGDSGSFRIVHAVAPHPGDDCGQAEFSAETGFRFAYPGNPYDDEMARLTEWYPNSAPARRFRGGEFAAGTN